MHNCENHFHGHTNAFVDLNGVPYLLGEYLDRRKFQQIDRSMIRSEIFVDQSEAMRAIIDISVDDIGKRASDSMPAIVGNCTKQKDLLEMISATAQRSDHRLDVLRRGIVLRVNYQLENQSTGQVIRSMTEDLRIDNRSYFLDINPRNVDDNAIVVNFANTMVSTINNFTHGTARMVMRITNIQMFYDCVTKDLKRPRIHQSLTSGYRPGYLPSSYGSEDEMYAYHKQMQNRHYLGYPGDDCLDWEGCDNSSITPPTWSDFNRFYHFDNGGRDIILHAQELNDPYCKTVLLSAGTVTVNRAFIINPGHRIIFKFSIWKNDVTVFNDTRNIAVALRVPVNDYGGDCDHEHEHEHHHHEHVVNPDYETLIRLYHDLQCTNDRQNCVINRIIDKIEDLGDKLDKLISPDEPDNPVNPDDPSPNPPDKEDPVVPPDNSDTPDVTPPNEDGGEPVT